MVWWFYKFYKVELSKVVSHDFDTAESFFTKITRHKEKWLSNSSYNPHQNSTKSHLKIISRTLDTFATKYENILLPGNFNACADDETMKDFHSSYGLHSLNKQPICFKHPEITSCIDLILTNKAKSLRSTCALETGSSDCYRMTISVTKMHFRKLSQVISYRTFKKFENRGLWILYNQLLKVKVTTMLKILTYFLTFVRRT